MWIDDLTIEELRRETAPDGRLAWEVPSQEYADAMMAANPSVREDFRGTLKGAYLVRHQRIVQAARRLRLIT